MADAAVSILFARWRAEPDQSVRRDLLSEIVGQQGTETCTTALTLLLEDEDLSPAHYAELGWVIRRLHCWNLDAIFVEQVASGIAAVAGSEALLALMEIAYEMGAPKGLAILEARAADTGLQGELRGFAIERIGLLGRASEHTINMIRHALQDTDASVRFWSCYSLASLGDSKDLPSIEALLSDRTEVSPFGTVAEQAAWTAETLRLNAVNETDRRNLG